MDCEKMGYWFFTFLSTTQSCNLHVILGEYPFMLVTVVDFLLKSEVIPMPVKLFNTNASARPKMMSHVTQPNLASM